MNSIIDPPAEKTKTQLIEEAMKILGNQATAEDLREYARPADSPIHHLIFDRDIDEAAEEYYLSKARHWIRTVKVVYESEEGESSGERAYTAVYVDKEDPLRTYMPTETVMTTDELAEQAIDEARRGLLGWQKRYRYLSSFPRFRLVFGPVLQAIDGIKLQERTTHP